MAGEKEIEFFTKTAGIAYRFKILVQMVIGALILILLSLKAFSHFSFCYPCSTWLSSPQILHLPALGLVSRGLAYSAGVELCYMLFTSGPDEAVEPVIMGLASYILLVVSGDSSVDYKIQPSLIAVSSLAIGFLFCIRRAFVEKPSPATAKKPTASSVKEGNILGALLEEVKGK